MKTISPGTLRGPVTMNAACLLILTTVLLTNSLTAFAACPNGNGQGNGQGNNGKGNGQGNGKGNNGKGGNQKGAKAIVKLSQVVVIVNPAPASPPAIRSSILAKPAVAPPAATKPAAPPAASQMTIEEQVLTNAQGFPLYYYDDDKDAKKPDCNKATNQACTTAWPPLLQSNGGSLTVAGLPVKLVPVQNANGQQITCLGHPLYTYIQDKMPLIALGDKREGGKWHVATPNTPPLPALS